VRSSCCGLVLLAVLSACTHSSPEPAEDVWRGLRWDMPIDRVAQTLSRQGLKVLERGPRKSPATWLSTEADGWRATVYFDDDGRMNQIAVIASAPTQEAADAAKERLTQRFGAVKETWVRTEQMWGPHIHRNAPWATLVVLQDPDDGWLAREEYGGAEGSGPVGAFELMWGQTPPDVEQRLRAAGFEVRTTGMLVDPCRMQNPPPHCEPDASVIVHFTKQQDEGNAEVHKKRGLVQVTFSARVGSYADGLARAKPIEAFRGPAQEIVEMTVTTWGNATANVSLDVRVKKPEGTLAVIESYSRPHS
jgi:hypothetical protein